MLLQDIKFERNYYIKFVAYLPWKSYFLWLTLQTKKRWIIGVFYHHYLYSGVTLFNYSFSDDFIYTWHVRYHPSQHMWKMKWICHLKHSLGLQIKRRFMCKSVKIQPQFYLSYKKYSFFYSWNFYCLTWLLRPQFTWQSSARMTRNS